MPMNTLDQDLQQRVLMAIQQGQPKEQALQMAEQVQAMRGNQPEAQMEQPGLLRTMAAPFERAGRTTGGALFEMARAGANPDIYSQGQTKTQQILNPVNKLAAMAGKLMGADLRYQDEQGQNVENPFLTEKAMGVIQANPVKEAAKTTAGLMSYAIPMGKLTAPVLSGAGASQLAGIAGRGALASGLFEAGLPGSNLEDIEKTAKSGALISAALPVVGRGLVAGKGVVSKGANSFLNNQSNKASAALLKATGAGVDEAIEAHGIDPIQLAKKYVTGGQNYDDLLGVAAERNKGGSLGTMMQQAEDVITQVRNAAGSNFRLDGDDIIKELKLQQKLLGNSLGNETKVKELDRLIKQAEKKYANGVTLNKALNTVRAANSKFGKAVTETTKGATVVSAQKAEANALRSAAKSFFPEIDQALQIQEDIFTLRPMLSRARGQASVARSVNAHLSISNLNRGGSGGAVMGGLTGNVLAGPPGMAIGAAIGGATEMGAKSLLSKPEIQTRMMQMGGQTASQVPGVMEKLSSLTGGTGAGSNLVRNIPAIVGSQAKGNKQAENDYQTQLSQIETETNSVAGGQLTPETRQKLYEARVQAGSEAKFKEMLELHRLQTGEDLAAVVYPKADDKTAAFVKQLQNTVNVMEQIYGENGKPLSLKSTAGVQGALTKGGRKYQVATNQAMQDRVTAYKQAAALAVGIINKARGAGTLNAGEFDIMMANIPNEYTSETAAKAWFTNARRILDNASPTTTNTSTE